MSPFEKFMIDFPEKTGVGIISFNRPALLKKCCDSIEKCGFIDEVIVVNDGDDIHMEIPCWWQWHQTAGSIGVGRSKNKALEYLLEQGCEHIFLIENDIYVKDPSVFEKYIQASKVSGIQHFNYSQHGNANKIPMKFVNPNMRLLVDYGVCKVAFYFHCVGAFSYYSRKCLELAGLMDERYYNACEHVDHTYQIIKAGMHPPFWAFADIENSWEYLGDDGWSIETSTISSNPNHAQMMRDADVIFLSKHGHVPMKTPFVEEIGPFLKNIKNTYGK